MTLLRIWSWLFIFASPFLIALYLFIVEPFKPAPSCNHMACVGKGIGEFFLVVFVYSAFLLIGIILNLIDFVRTRRTASVLRKIEIIVFTAPIWLWVFAIPTAIQEMVDRKNFDQLAPYMEVLENYSTADYDQLSTAISVMTDADPDIKNHFSSLDYYLKDATIRINQIDFIKKNKKRRFPSDFSINPFQLCIYDMGYAGNMGWKITYFKKDGEFSELSILANSETLISGQTNQGCSHVNDTSLLNPVIQNGQTLFVVIGSRVAFIEIDSTNHMLTIQHSISTDRYDIDIKPLP
jgi:hypothetical protein